MKKSADYRLHAIECRQLAARAVTPAEREQLLEMAQTWDSLAQEREEAAKRAAAIAS